MFRLYKAAIMRVYFRIQKKEILQLYNFLPVHSAVYGLTMAALYSRNMELFQICCNKMLCID